MATEKQKASSRKYYYRHHEKVIADAKAYRDSHKKERKERARIYNIEHPEERKAYNRAYKIDHQEDVMNWRRKWNLKKSYGISLENYETILAQQNGVCKICGNPPNEKKLAVDHDHSTGKIRGLLCNSCNVMLGLAKNNRTTLQSALIYLIKSQLEIP